MNGSAADVSADYAAFDAVTSNKAFVEAAKLYKLNGKLSSIKGMGVVFPRIFSGTRASFR